MPLVRNDKNFRNRKKVLAFSGILCYNTLAVREQRRKYPGVAKFGIALEWGSRGRWFESSHSDQKRTLPYTGAHKKVIDKLRLRHLSDGVGKRDNGYSVKAEYPLFFCPCVEAIDPKFPQILPTIIYAIKKILSIYKFSKTPNFLNEKILTV